MTTPIPAATVAAALESFTSRGIVADTRRGLLDSPKWLSSLYFYDRRGSELFEQITRTPEYYPTRTEEQILQENGAAMLEVAGTPLLMAELGSGSSRKTRVLLDALLARQPGATYVPVDVSEQFLEDVAAQLARRFPGLDVRPLASEYHAGLRSIGAMPAARRLVLFLGSSIGNFEPDEQVDLMRAAHAALSPGDAFLLGTDLVKDAKVLHAAYNDAAGVTARFNLNILRRINRELGGDIEESSFGHRAHWNPDKRRIEMHLVSRQDQVLHLPGADLRVPIKRGETIHTENSYKFTIDDARRLAEDAGFTLEKTWTDAQKWFGVHLLRR